MQPAGRNIRHIWLHQNEIYVFTLTHTKLDVFIAGKNFVLSCYKLSKFLPPDERFNMVQQLRRAALSVQLNIAEGSSRKSAIERRRFYEVSGGSLIEIDTIFDLAVELEYFKKEDLEQCGNVLLKTYQMLSKMIIY